MMMKRRIVRGGGGQEEDTRLRRVAHKNAERSKRDSQSESEERKRKRRRGGWRAGLRDGVFVSLQRRHLPLVDLLTAAPPHTPPRVTPSHWVTRASRWSRAQHGSQAAVTARSMAVTRQSRAPWPRQGWAHTLAPRVSCRPRRNAPSPPCHSPRSVSFFAPFSFWA